MTTAVASRSKRLSIAFGLGAALVVALAVMAMGWLHSSPSSYRITLTMSPPCQNPGLVEVGGHSWAGDQIVPATWGKSIRGAFHILSDGQAVFTADSGGQTTFYRLPPPAFYPLTCRVR